MGSKALKTQLNLLDFNLLLDLDTLLREGSVVGAARALHLSSPAMSRRLTRLREALGDPLFVAAGRGLVPTERALALREKVRVAIESVRSVFVPEGVDLQKLQRTFVLRANDGFAGAFATRLLDVLKKEAPAVCLKFIPRVDKDVEALRTGSVDLDLGVVESAESEFRTELLFEAPFVGVVRDKHPLVRKDSKFRVSLQDFLAWEHISTSPRGQGVGRLDEALKKHGMQRRIGIIAPGFQAALVMASSSNLVAVMPEPFARWAQPHLRLRIFSLPVSASKVEVVQGWHVRHHIDPVHIWLRQHVKRICADESK